MSKCFEIVVSEMVVPQIVEALLSGLLPDTSIVVTNGPEVPHPFPDVWVRLDTTNDAAWPSVLQFVSFPDRTQLGPYPDLVIAEHLLRRQGANSLCGVSDALVNGLDSHDPYWYLAFVNGEWYLADACNAPLMGTYTDGTTTFVGSEQVRLVRKLELSFPNDFHKERESGSA